MTLLVNDPELRERLIAQRKDSGADRYDEVWEGDYVMSPLAGDEHQELVGKLTAILEYCVGMPGLGAVRPGVNVSDRDADWPRNYRVPDVAVRLNEGSAVIRPSHWWGGPDFLVEVLSEGDRARDKLPFYASIGTREALIVDRAPWSLELYRLQGDRLLPVAVSRPELDQTITSAVVPLTFRLLPAEGRPRFEVTLAGTGQIWSF